MRIIQSVGPDVSVCLTNDNRIVLMIEDADGEHMAEIPDVSRLSEAARELTVSRVFGEHPVGQVTSAEAEFTRNNPPKA